MVRGKIQLFIILLLVLISTSSAIEFGDFQYEETTGIDGLEVTTTQTEDLIIIMNDEPVNFINSFTKHKESFQEKKEAINDRIQKQDIKVYKSKDVKLINAIAIKINKKDKDKLKNIKGVKAILPDRQLHITLETSVAAINATQVWQLTNGTDNITGKGISIAILDTGIDYAHPDLGGCFGPGCRVVDGYDSINEDADPMDDNGHGTHCAGISAGNGNIIGVAPEATLYAYKVLNSAGSGSESQIINGIDRALDPNQDGNKIDHVDIISMSLGGAGDENSALSLAVNDAVDEGVFVVVAAGNDGPTEYTVGSPASSEKALTVGSSNDNGQISSFSSRGPTPNNNIKPDVIAPGSVINSTVPTGFCDHCSPTTYMELSGTSMATPHVAGVAALILQNRNLQPLEVKSAIATTAIDKGYNVTVQGTGFVDSLEAVNVEAIAIPNNLNLGTNDPAQQTFIVQKNISLKNLVANTDYNFSFTADAGVDISFTQSTVNLNQEESTIVGVTFTVNNSIVSDGRHEGKLYINSATESLTIPYMFFKDTIITFNFFDGGVATSPEWFIIHDRVSQKWNFQSPGVSKQVSITPGIYDYIVTFGGSSNYVVIKENQNITGVVNVDKNVATNKVTIDLKDKDLNSINPTTDKVMKILKYRNDINLFRLWSMTSGGGIPESTVEKYFNDFSANYSYDWEFPFYYNDVLYDASDLVTEITASVTSSNSNMKRIDISLPNILSSYAIKHASQSQGQTIIGLMHGASGNSMEAYFSQKPASDHSFNHAWLTAEEYTTPKITNVTLSDFDLELNGKIIPDKNTSMLTFGTQPFFYYGKFANVAGDITLNSYSQSGQDYIYLTQGFSTITKDPVQYKLFQAGSVVNSGNLAGAGDFVLSKPLGLYTLSLNNSYLTNGIPHSAIVNATFDTNNADSNAPSIKSIHVLVDGLPTDSIDTSKDNNIAFELDAVGGAITTTNMWYSYPGKSWTALSLTSNANAYNTLLNENINGSFVNFKIQATDNSGNKITYIFDLATTAGADFTVTDVVFDDEIPTEGNIITINATIQNAGIEDATNVNVSFYLDNLTGTKIGEIVLAELNNSQSIIVSQPWTTVAGLHKIYVDVDHMESISELDESNNNYYNEIYVKRASENFLQNFTDNTFSKQYLLPIATNNQEMIMLPAHARVNYATIDIGGNVYVISNSTIVQDQVSASFDYITATYSRYGQSFTPNASCTSLKHIDLWMTKGGGTETFSEPVTMNILKGVDDPYMESVTLQPDDISNHPVQNWARFSFSSPSLTPGDVYHFKPTSDNLNADGVYGMYYQGTDVYPGGSYYNWITKSYFTNKDYKFRIFCEDAVPLNSLAFYLEDTSLWNYNGDYRTETRMDDFTSDLNNYLQDKNTSNVNVPFNFTTQSAGQLDINDLRVYYDYPDFELVDVSLPVGTHGIGSTQTVTANVRNNLGNNVDGLSVRFYINNISSENNIHNATINTIGNFTQVYQFNHTVQAGENIIFAVVEEDNIFVESNEGNNQDSFNLTLNSAPVFSTTSSEVLFNEGSLLEVNLSAIDADLDNLTFNVTGDKFNQVDNLFTWQTNYTDSGNYTFDFTVTDGVFTDTIQYNITVWNVNRAPVLDALSNININESETVVYNLTGSDPDSDAVTFLVNDTRFVQTGNNFTWTTNSSDAGTYYVEFKATDGNLNDTQVVNIVVNDVVLLACNAGSSVVSGLEPLIVDLTSNIVGGSVPYNVTWDFDNNGIYDNFSFNTTNIFSAGLYDVNLTVFDNDLNSCTDSVTINVTGDSAPSASIGTNATSGTKPVCIQYTGSSATGNLPLNYTWDFENNGIIDVYSINAEYCFNTAGSFDTKLTVIDNDGDSDSDIVTITVNPTAIPAPIINTNVTSGLDPLYVQFNGFSSVGDNPLNYTWDFENDGTIDSYLQNVSNMFTTGNYDVNLTITDNDGDSNSTITTISVGSDTNPTPSISLNVTSGIETLYVLLDGSVASGNAPFNYTWDIDNDGTIEYYTEDSAHSFTAGNYTINFTVCDLQNDCNSDTNTVQVYADENVNVNINANPVSGQEPLSVLFSSTVTAGNSPFTYAWDFDNNGGTDSTAANPSNTFNGGTYLVNLTVTDANGDKGYATVSINVAADLSPTASISVNGTSGYKPYYVAFDGTGVGGDAPLTYAWDFEDDGTIDSTSEDPVHTYELEGTYTAKLTVTDNDGDSHSSTKQVTVNTRTYTCKTAALDDVTRDYIDDSTIIFDGIMKDATPLAFFTAEAGRLLVFTAGRQDYEEDTDLHYFDPGLPDCSGTICNMQSKDAYNQVYSTSCTWDASYGDWECFMTNNGNTRGYYYKPAENRVTIANYLKLK